MFYKRNQLHVPITFLYCLTKRLEYISRRHLLPVKGIHVQRLHAFRFTFGYTNVGFVKTGSDDVEYHLKVCRVAPPRDAYSTVLNPVGLSIHVYGVANYLFKVVRHLVRSR